MILNLKLLISQLRLLSQPLFSSYRLQPFFQSNVSRRAALETGFYLNLIVDHRRMHMDLMIDVDGGDASMGYHAAFTRLLKASWGFQDPLQRYRHDMMMPTTSFHLT